VEFCPKGVLGLVKQKCRIVEPEKCTKCGLCEMRCPDYAIWLEEVEDMGASQSAEVSAKPGKAVKEVEENG
jgi:MinD superfamily P-loop ATPase